MSPNGHLQKIMSFSDRTEYVEFSLQSIPWKCLEFPYYKLMTSIKMRNFWYKSNPLLEAKVDLEPKQRVVVQ